MIACGSRTGFDSPSDNPAASFPGCTDAPQAPKWAGASRHILVLASPVHVGPAKRALFLEFGAHPSHRSEDTVIHSLHRHQIKGIVLSWAPCGPRDVGHGKQRTVEYVTAHFEMRNLMGDRQEKALRSVAPWSGFRRNILALRKRNEPPQERPESEALAEVKRDAEQGGSI